MLPRGDLSTFAGGEISDQVAGRYDTQKYGTALRRLRNMLIEPEGGIYNRPGFEFVGEARDSTKRLWLMPFQYTATQSLVLEWGDEELRVIYDGGYVLKPGLEITAATNSNPLVMTIPSSGYAVGTDVYFSGVEGMVQINGRRLRVTAVAGDDVTFSADSTAWGVFTGSGGGVAGDAGGDVGGLPSPPTDGDPTPPTPDLPPPPPIIYPLPPLDDSIS